MSYAYDGAFRDAWMLGDHGFDLPRGQPMAGDIHDVVGATQDEQITVVIEIASVAGGVVPRKGLEV